MIKQGLMALLLLSVAGVGVASEAERIKHLEEVLQNAVNVRPDTIRAVVPERIYEASVDGQVFYITAEGDYLFSGELYDLQARVNLTERSRNQQRLSQLQQLPESELITYRAKGDEKHVITIFTDIDCGYCRRLHRGMDEMNELGITVHYLAFPRSPVGTASFNKSVSVWCADDPAQAMTDAKLNNRVVDANCASAPVAKHQQLGRQLGVTGTPAILLENGTLIPGYLPPGRLLEAIKERS